MRPAIVVVLVSAGLMTPVTGTFAQPRSAQGACNPNRPSDFPLNRWAGWNVDGRGQTIGGVYARIFNYVPYVDPVSQGDFVYTWTMLTVDHPLGADAPYVQVGWVQFANRKGNFTFMVGGRDLHDDLPAWFTPTRAEVYAETLSLASQMPGGRDPGSRQDLLDSSYYMNGAWHSFMPAATINVNDIRGRDDSQYFGHTSPLSGGDLSIWDTACTR